MAVTEEARHEVHSYFKEAMGRKRAATLMDMLPPAGWGDVATKADLAAMKQDLTVEITTVRKDLTAEITTVRKDLTAEIAAVRQDLTAETTALRKDLTAEITAVRQDLTAETTALRKDLTAETTALRKDLTAETTALRKDLTADIATGRKDLTHLATSMEQGFEHQRELTSLEIRGAVGELRAEFHRVMRIQVLTLVFVMSVLLGILRFD